MTNLDLILTRQSPLTLRTPGPDDAALKAILTAAMCGPDHGKLKPWRFIVIEGEGRYAFGQVLRDALCRRAPATAEAVLALEQAKPLRAPTIVIAVTRVQERKLIPRAEQIVAAGIAAYNVLLAAHALGFGGFWRTGASAYDSEVKQALDVRADDVIVGFLYLGTPGTMPHPRELGDLDGRVNRWRRPVSALPEPAS